MADNHGDIKNINLDNIYIDCNGFGSIGSLAGTNRGNIYDCSVSGEIVNAGTYTGSIVGHSSRANIYDCSSTVSIIGIWLEV